jgi:molybdopterin converting factor small subunit
MASCVVPVKFLGLLQHLAGCRKVAVEVDTKATVGDLLASLAALYGPEFTTAVFRAPGEVHTHLRVFLNEQDAQVTDRIAADGEAPQVAVLVVPGFEGGSR